MTRISLFLVAALAVAVGCKAERDAKSVEPLPDERAVLLELPCVAAPGKAELLEEDLSARQKRRTPWRGMA